MSDSDDLHERVILLKREIEAGRFHAPAESGLMRSIANVKIDDAGRVDPETVDPLVRAASLAVVAATRERKLLSIPLRDVQAAYFDALDELFGPIYSKMKDRGLNPHQVATNMAATEELVSSWASESDSYVHAFESFWETNKEIVRAHLWRQDGLKAAFGGDVFPSYSNNIACSAGLYVDTIILPDPLLRVLPLFKPMSPERQVYYVAKHALNAMAYREIALSETDQPIVVITPDLSLLSSSELRFLTAIGEQDTLHHFSRLFGKSFEYGEELLSFLSGFRNTTELLNSLTDPSRLLVDAESSATLADQLKGYKARYEGEVATVFDSLGDGLVYPLIYGRMMQANDALHKARYFKAHPLVQAPTSWQYLLWKYEYDAAGSVNQDLTDAVISRTLVAEQSQYEGLIRDIPPDVLIELRKRGALADLRKLINDGINEINLADEESVRAVSEDVLANISEAVAQHQKELQNLTASKRRFYGFDVSGWIVTGGVSVAAAASGNVALALLAAFAGLAGFPSMRDLWAKRKELAEQKGELERSPVALCFRR